MLRALLLMIVLAWGAAASAQTELSPPVQVFVERGDSGDTLIFVNLATGEISRTAVGSGERYTAAGDGVIYWEAGAVRLATPDGSLQPHPYITSGADDRRVDWVVADDERLIVWTTTAAGPDGGLTTTTTVAKMDGSDARVVLTDGPRAGIRALPVAFSADGRDLFMDYQPDGIGAATPYDEYAGLFAVSLRENGETQPLPGEPGCYCGAGFGGGYMVRLTLSDDASAFGVRVLNWLSGVERTLDAVTLNGYTQGEDVLVSPDGRRAIYALARVQDFNTPSQTVQAVFVLVNLEDMTQEQITTPQTLYLRPQAWTEDNSAVILTSPTRPGTWKMAQDGRLDMLASATYIGTLNRAASRSPADMP